MTGYPDRTMLTDSNDPDILESVNGHMDRGGIRAAFEEFHDRVRL